MNCKYIQKLIDNTDYWDERVNSLKCNYFSDEVILTFRDNDYLVSYTFIECYKVFFEHVKSYKKNIPVKDMIYTQLPYFLIDINVEEVYEDENEFLKFSINMFPLSVEIWCMDVIVNREYQGDGSVDNV